MRITNYELLKSMTIEEMAVTIMCPADYDYDFERKCNPESRTEKNCCKCTLEWLKSEI